MNRSKIIAGIEMGTSKVVVLVGEVVNGRSLNIIGLGEATSMGIRKGEIVDLRAASDCTHAAIVAAEKNAGAQIDGVFLASTGRQIEGFPNPGIATVSDADNEVSDADIARAVEDAKSKALPPGRVYIHHIRNGYCLDGKVVQDPLRMQGQKLEVGYWHVHGSERTLRDQISVINGINLEVEDVIVSSIASGSAVATDAEKRNGVLVIDIGCGTTDYVLYRNGWAVRTGVIAVGGDHLTNDLSLGLRVNYKHAENLKLRHGKAVTEKSDRSETVMLVGDLMIGDRPIPLYSIEKILEARVSELFMILKNRLGSALSPQNLPGGVVMTGGSSRLARIADQARAVFGVDVRLGENPEWVNTQELRSPEYSTAIGLLYYGLKGQRKPERQAPRRATGLLGKFAGIFK